MNFHLYKNTRQAKKPTGDIVSNKLPTRPVEGFKYQT